MHNRFSELKCHICATEIPEVVNVQSIVQNVNLLIGDLLARELADSPDDRLQVLLHVFKPDKQHVGMVLLGPTTLSTMDKNYKINLFSIRINNLCIL